MSDYVREARRAKREGDYIKAGDFYYLAGDEKNALEMYLRGNHYALAARLSEKREDWKSAAKYYIQSGKYQDAAEIYSNKLKDYRTAAAMFEKNGDLSRASEMAEKAGDFAKAGLLAEQADLWERAAHLYTHAQKFERAADLYFRIMKRASTEEEKGYHDQRARISKVGNAAGLLYLRLKKYERAGQCFEESENLPKAAECYSLAQKPEKAAELYFRLQEYDTAYSLLTSLGDKLENRELLADVSFQLKKFNEAGEYYVLVGKHQRAAEAFEEGQDYYRAILFYKALEDYAKAGELYIKSNEIEKAAECYEKAKNFEYAAKLYEQVGMVEQAIACLDSAGQRIKAAKLLTQRAETQKAISILQQIGREEDDYPDACILLGQLFTQMEMYSVAQQKFAEAIGSQPLSQENIQTYYDLAKAYEKSAQYSKARETYEKILSVQLDYKDAFDRLQRIKTTNLLDGVSAEITPSSYKRVLAGRYELNEKLDRGPFGILYKAHDLTLGRTVLVRRFPEQDKNITRDIVDQTRIISALSHSNILSLYDSGKDENHYFLVMEYAEGPSLRQHLSGGSFDISEICEIASQICLALGYAHKKGVVHKNLSPENIYINPGTVVKIAHFGIESKWEKGSTLVAKQYNSPEQLMGQKIDGRSDLYSFGTVLYEMLYGAPPFSGQDVELQHLKSEVSFPDTPRFQVPAFLLKIIRKCMQKNKQKRYLSAEEILEELEVADIVPGMVLNQRYEIIKVLGVGGMGHVYQARDRDLDEVVALKVLRAEISADPMIQKRFLREIKITRMITHPHVVKVFDIGKYKGNRYISMEYIEGMSLDDWLKKNKVDTRNLLNLLAKIIQGVQAAHSQGIIHRDLKPQNVLIDRSSNPHVLDFGIARSKEHVDATSGQIMGSPKYMSPEQIQGKDLDKRSDVYAIGVLMYLMFTGEEPFQGDDPRAIIMKHLTQPPPPMSHVPEWVEKIVTKALEKDRNVRYASLKEILDDLKKGYETQKI